MQMEQKRKAPDYASPVRAAKIAKTIVTRRTQYQRNAQWRSESSLKACLGKRFSDAYKKGTKMAEEKAQGKLALTYKQIADQDSISGRNFSSSWFYGLQQEELLLARMYQRQWRDEEQKKRAEKKLVKHKSLIWLRSRFITNTKEVIS